MDYKDWVQSRAEEIAAKNHDKDFCDLSEGKQTTVYNQATEDCRELVAGMDIRPW